jgi:hypothetical protein
MMAKLNRSISPAHHVCAGGALCVLLSALVSVGALHAAELGAVKELTFDDVKLEMKKGDPYDSSLLTDKIKQLDGKSIRIRVKQFVLVRDNMECCFGPGAMLHDCILVEMVGSASTSFTVRPVSVEGKFSIREVKDPVNGNYLAIYHLDGTEVK